MPVQAGGDADMVGTAVPAAARRRSMIETVVAEARRRVERVRGGDATVMPLSRTHRLLERRNCDGSGCTQ